MQRISLFGAVAVWFTFNGAGAECQPPASQRPSITVAVFEFGTVSPRIHGDHGRGSRRRDESDYQGSAFAEAIGTGAADLIVEKLVESERFRVFERKQLEAVTREQRLDDEEDSLARARYIVTGSVSHLGTNDKNVGGLLTGFASGMLFRGLGAIRTNQSSTTVHLTARVVDTRTGEIIGSFTGEGESKKRWGVDVLGAGRGGLGATTVSDRNFRETAIGEATARAAAAIAEGVVALRATRLRP
jgi:curli biogenesis system outer membrane secretion channel CsgG